MTNFWLIVIGASSLAVDVVLIVLILQVLRAVTSLRRVVDVKMEPILKDVESVTGNVREMADNAKGIVEDVREFSSSVKEVGRTVRAVNDLAGGIGSSATIRAVSLKAGIVAGVQYLLTNLLRKGDEK
jgi:uncharacterized protein YoxC